MHSSTLLLDAMEYLSRLSGLVSTPGKASASSSSASGSRLRHKPSLHPVGSVDVFHADWTAVKVELQNPDERALFHGVTRSQLPHRLQRIVDALVFESNRSNDGHTGPCMEYLLKYDILSELVELSSEDRPTGIMGETIRTLTNLIILLDEKFLSRRAAHKPISQLIQRCLDEDAARFDFDEEESAYTPTASATIDEPVYNEDLVDLMCHIASRIRNSPDLLQIVFSDELIRSDVDLARESQSSRDGSVIISHEPQQDISDRPTSPTESADSTKTVQPAKVGRSSSDSSDSSRSRSRKDTGLKSVRRLCFPLFSYLLKFVHREGRIGELARAGLHFLISLQASHDPAGRSRHDRDSSSKAEPSHDVMLSLATFIAQSDFADVLGAGLGAAYGLLPSRIWPEPRYDPAVVATTKSRESTIILGSGSATDKASSDSAMLGTLSNDPELQTQLRLLVDLLDFCQDVLDSLSSTTRHLPSHDSDRGSSDELHAVIVKLAGGIAAAVRDTFIRNVVYPSLMESSDSDGSATAVLSYLDIISLNLRNGHILTEVVLDFLLASDSSEDAKKFDFYGIDTRLDPDRYNIKDLILDNMHSKKRAATRVAALQLARTLLIRHGTRAAAGLLLSHRLKNLEGALERRNSSSDSAYHLTNYNDTESSQTVDIHLLEMDQYAALFAKESSAKLQASLSTYLADAELGLRMNSTFSHALLPNNANHKSVLDRADPFVQRLFDNLAQLFLQPVESNVAATGVISALALSPSRSLDGWLTYEHAAYHSSASSGNLDKVPVLLDILRELTAQTQSYRDCISDFDRYLAERRRGLALNDDITEALEAEEILESDENSTKTVEDGREAEVSNADPDRRRHLQTCLTLPRVLAPHGDQDRKLVTDEQRRLGEKQFGIVEDRRAELGSSQDSQYSSSAPDGIQSKRPEDDDTKSEPEVRSSALARLFGGRPTRSGMSGVRNASGTSSTSAGDTGGRRPSGGTRKVSAFTINPFTDHYRQTTAVLVRAQAAAAAPLWRSSASEITAVVTLSSVLDNTILLQELVKELLAIIQVRRSWGIDPVLFA